MPPVVRAHIQPDTGKFCLDQIHDARSRAAIVHADADETRIHRARGAEYVQTRAVPVINFESKSAGLADHFRIGVDRGDVDSLRQQTLRNDLSESSEPDYQHRAAHFSKIVRFMLVRTSEAVQQRLGKARYSRTHQHRPGSDCGEDRRLLRIEGAERRTEWN